jgi:predicted small integral membrane protein
MGRIVKALLVLAIAAFLALVAYAYLGDLTPEQVPVTKPVELDAD